MVGLCNLEIYGGVYVTWRLCGWLCNLEIVWLVM